ncbi:MAG: SRPBCC domain-containing protein [Terriglobia bacterium]
MPTLHRAQDADSMGSEIQIAAPPEHVFHALTDPQQVVQWCVGQGAGATFRCAEFAADLRVGGNWRSVGVTSEGHRFEIAGQYLEVDPPRLLVQTWVSSWTGDIQTTVRWELEPTSHDTLLRIRHSGLAAHPELANSYRGWPRILGWIQRLLEHGETVDDRK